MGSDVTLWVKPHLPKKGDKYLSFSFALVNLHIEERTISFTPGEYGLNCNDGYTVMVNIYFYFFIVSLLIINP